VGRRHLDAYYCFRLAREHQRRYTLTT